MWKSTYFPSRILSQTENKFIIQTLDIGFIVLQDVLRYLQGKFYSEYKS